MMPANDTTTTSTDKITVWEIRAKDVKRGGTVYQGAVAAGHHAEIVPGRSIRLFGLVKAGSRYVPGPDGQQVPCEEHVYRRDFAIGDTAEYHSYNFSYMGDIVAITAKTVSIREHNGSKIHRLDLHTFDWRNWDLDLAKEAERYANWRD